jgi:paraquat-inducible protein A
LRVGYYFADLTKNDAMAQTDTNNQIQVACLRCDKLFTMQPLKPAQQARCPRCGKVYSVYRHNFLQRSLAFVTAAGLCFIGSLSSRFISIHVSGIEQGITLQQSGTALLTGQEPTLGMLVLLLILLVPATLITLLSLMLVALLRGIKHDYLPWLARVIDEISHWNMLEVFLIGTLVSLTKLASLARVELGFSFWCFIVCTLCLIAAVSSLDRLALWARIRQVMA